MNDPQCTIRQIEMSEEYKQFAYMAEYLKAFRIDKWRSRAANIDDTIDIVSCSISNIAV